MRRLIGMGVLAVMAACSLPKVQQQPREPDYWPTLGWKTATPESQGVDSSALVDMLAHLANAGSDIHSLVVVRHGYVILDAAFYPYNGATPHDIASVTKSVISTLLAAVIESGTLESLDHSVAGMLGVDPADLDDPSKDDITLADLVAMRAGFDCGLSPGEPELRAMMASSDWIDFALSLPLADPPGTRFAYCSPGFHLLSAAITEATGATARDLATRLLFGPLGIVPGDWPIGPSGYNHGWGDLRLRPLDLAKIGFLFLHDGHWDKKRILPKIGSRKPRARAVPQVWALTAMGWAGGCRAAILRERTRPAAAAGKELSSSRLSIWWWSRPAPASSRR